MTQKKANKKRTDYLANTAKVAVAVSLVATAVPITASAATGYDSSQVDASYYATSNVTGGVAVSLTEAGKATTGEVHIPSEIGGKAVIAINPSGFADAKASAIHFENSDLIQTIGNYAFYNSNATNAVSFQNVAVIPENTFHGTKFSSIQLNSAVVTTIGANAFTNAEATNALSFGAVTAIPKEAFKGSQFSSIGLGASVTSIGESAFEDTKATNAISLENITTVPKQAFANASFNAINLNANIKTLGEKAFYYAGATNAITLSGLTGVSTSAFEGSNFEGILLDSAKVTTLGANAFKDSKAKNVMTLEAITTVPLNAFKGTQFSEIHFNPTKVTSVGISAFEDAQATNELVLSKVAMISDNAFMNAHFSVIALTPSTLTSVSTKAFTKDLEANATEQEHKGKTSTVTVEPITQVNVTSIKYAVGTQTALYFETGGTDITASSEFTVSSNGTYTVYVKDGAKRTTVQTITVQNVDKIPPTVSLTEQSTWSNASVAVTVNATDSAGIGKVKWLAGNKSLADFASAGTDVVDNTFNATEKGIYTVYVEDTVGNATVQSITVSKLDKTPPTLTLSEQTAVGTTTKVTAVTSDGESGAGELYYIEGSYTADNFPVATATEITATKTFTEAKNATFTVLSVDKAGNRTVKEIKTTKVDLTPPTVVFSKNGGTSAKAHSTKVTASDDNNVASLKYQWSTSADTVNESAWTTLTNGDTITSLVGVTGSYYLHVKAADTLGNTATVVSQEFAVDNTPPNAPTFTASSANKTNGDVSVTVAYAVDSELSEYRVNGGSWQPYLSAIVMTTNGKVEARSTDVAGNVSAEATYTVTNIDKVAPIVSATEQQTWGQKTTVNVQASDAGVGVETIKYAKGNFTIDSFPPLDTTDITATKAFSVAENATYTILVTDKAGNKTAYVMTTTKADADAPIIALTEQAFAGKVSTVTVQVTDALSGVLETKWLAGLKTTHDFVTAGETLGSNGSFTVNDNGVYSVYAKDTAGNETVKSITVEKIDVTAPTLTLTEQANWDAQQSTVTVVPTDNLSGVAKVKWLLGTRTVEDFKVAGTTITDTNKFTATTNGVYTVFVEDGAGNGTVKTITVNKIDVNAPTVSAVEQATWGKTTTVTVSANDAESGVQKISYVKGTYTENTFPSGATDITTSKSFTVNENTAYTILATDKVGNKKVTVVTTKKADTTPVTLSLTEQDNIAKTVNITVNAIETQSGIASIKWLSGAKTVNDFASAGTDITAGKAFTVTENGVYTVYAKDNVGNETVKTISVGNIDVVAPTVTLTSALNWGITSTITVAPLDDHAGIKSVKWLTGKKTAADFGSAGTEITDTNTFTVTENGWYTVYVEDNAGNFTVETIEITQVDTTLPTVTLIEQSQWDNASSKVTVIPLDDLADVRVVKWLKGDVEVAGFTGAGNDITGAKEFTATENGVYTVYVEDNAGNKVVQPIVVAKIDKQAPTMTYTEQESWGKTTKVNVTPKDVGSGVQAMTYVKGTYTLANFPTAGATNITSTKAFTGSENTAYTILIEDKVGNKSVHVVTTTKADTTAPTLKVDVAQDVARDSTIMVVADDSQSGVAMIKWLEGTKTFADFASAGSEITAASKFTVNENGVYTVYTKDAVGNERVQTVNVTNIDKESPILTLTEQTSWGQSSKITVGAIDSIAGIKTVKWLSGIKSAEDFANAGSLVVDNAFNVTENGIHTVYAEDNIGNTVTQKISVGMIDSISPNVAHTVQATTGNTANVTVHADDTESGVQKIKWLSGHKSAEDFEENGKDITESKEFSVTENGTYTVFVVDVVGNITVTAIDVTAIDTAAPTIHVDVPSAIGLSAEIKVIAVDEDASVAEVKWLTGEHTVTDFESSGELITTGSFTVTNNGLYTIYAVDTHGNGAVKIIEVKTVDNEPPVITMTSSATGAKEATVIVNITDVSPISEVKWLAGDKAITDFKLAGEDVTDGSFKVTETGIYTVYVVDALGQESVKKIDVTSVTQETTGGGSENTGGGTSTGGGSENTGGGTSTGGGSENTGGGTSTGGGSENTGGGTSTGGGSENTGGGSSTGGGTGNTGESKEPAETITPTPSYVVDVLTDGSNDVVIKIPNEVVDKYPTGSTTLTVSSDTIYAVVNGEQIEVGKLSSKVDPSSLRAYRAVASEPTTVMHFTTKQDLKITSKNGLNDLVITSRMNADFTDVKSDAWFADYVDDLYNYLIIKGTTATTFSPNDAITRGQFATMIARALELTDKSASAYTLNDLNGKHYADAVQALMELDIITGFEDGTFRGNDTITRQQAMAMLGRMMTHLNVDASPTSKVQLADMHRVADYAKEYVEYFAENNVINSGVDVKFNPKDNVTRAQLSKMLLNALRLSDFY